MKKLELIRLLPLALVVVFMTTITTSCSEDNEPAPEYAGKWLTEKTLAVSSGYTKVNYTLEITGNRFIETFFEDVYLYKYPGPGTFVSIEGSISVSGNSIKFAPSKISLSSFDYRTSVLSAPYKVHSSIDQDFQSIFNSLDLPTSKYQSEFSVENDTLILKADKNNDGAYSGLDEVITYAKKLSLEVKAPAF